MTQAAAPPKSRRGPWFFGWWIVAASTGIEALLGGLLQNAFGAYVLPIQAEFGWNKTAFAGASALQTFETGALGPVQGWLIDRFGSRRIVQIGLVMAGIGFVLFSYSDSLLTFYLSFAVLALGASLAGYIALSVAVVNWFQRQRSTALGLMLAGYSVGGMIVPLVAWSLNTNGWRPTAAASGFILVILGLPLTALIRNRPEDHGLLPDGDPPAGASNGEAPRKPSPPAISFTTGEAMRTRAFWLLGLGHSFALLVINALNVHLISHVTETLGVSLAVGASIITVTTATSLVGQVAGGFLGDRLDKRLLTACCMLGHLVALVLIALANTFALMVLAAIVQGIAWGIRSPLIQAIRGDYFGRGSYGSILGWSSLLSMIGSLAGPLLAAVLYDNLGNYQLSFMILAAFAGIGSLFFLFATKPAPPVRPSLQ